MCVCVYEADVYTAIFIFNLCVWTSEMRKHTICNVKTAYAVTEQISAITAAALFMFVYSFLITLS